YTTCHKAKTEPWHENPQPSTWNAATQGGPARRNPSWSSYSDSSPTSCPGDPRTQEARAVVALASWPASLCRPLGDEAMGAVVTQIVEPPRQAVLLLDLRKLVHGQRPVLRAQLEVVHAGRVVPEDLILHGPVGRPQRRKPVLLLHVLRDLQAAQGLN